MSPTAHRVRPRPLVVFADDWGRHPSSCQHLVRHLVPGREVVWVNTIGTRPVRLDLSTARRAAGKLAGWLAPRTRSPVGGDAEPAPQVLSPKMWPSFHSQLARRVNRRMLARTVGPVLDRLADAAVLTTLPLVSDLAGQFPNWRWVYYCVDDFSVWPGYDGATLGQLERELVPRMSACLAVSPPLVAHLKALGATAELLTHGVELDGWRAEQSIEVPPEFVGISGPIALFWGVIDRRLDLDVVRAVAEQSGATAVLVGPREDPDPALGAIPNVRLRPAVPITRLPQLAQAANVLIMPYADLPVTRAMQPLKLKEYLATGRPAVVTDLPSTREWADALDIAATPAAFAQAVRQRLTSGPPEGQRVARQRLASESWATKAERLAEVLDGESGGASETPSP